jgi:hypothetical protein
VSAMFDLDRLGSCSGRLVGNPNLIALRQVCPSLAHNRQQAPMELPNAQDRTYDSKRWLHHSSSDMSRVLNALAFLFLYVRGFTPQLKWLICRGA